MITRDEARRDEFLADFRHYRVDESRFFEMDEGADVTVCLEEELDGFHVSEWHGYDRVFHEIWEDYDDACSVYRDLCERYERGVLG